jgi:NAD(P)H-hydrate epimerase
MRAGVWALVGAAEMRALDRHTIEGLGVPAALLMELAGRAVSDVVLALREDPGDPVLVVCGGGNNCGDGLVVARQLQLIGVPVRVAMLGPAPALRGDAAENWKRLEAVGVPVEGPRWRTPARGVLVDAIFGTGLSRPVEGVAAASIRRINSARRAHGAALRVVAIDIPSGLCADTGQVLGGAVEADATVTIGLPKLGLALEPGRSHAGEITVARIGIADEAPDLKPRAELFTRFGAGTLLPRRPADGHKGSFGHALVVGASEGKTGAVALAAEAAARIGAGLVTIACPAGLNDILEIKCTEAMTAPLPDTGERALDGRAEAPLRRLARDRDAVGLGPGLGQGAETAKLVRAVVVDLDRPLALDADGLNALDGDPGLLARRTAATVLTPHPGEAARLLHTRAAELNRDRVGAARALAERSGAVVILKGAASVIAGPDGRVAVNPTGGPALATGGTGDVLLGMVTGLLAQGLAAFESAVLAAFVHGLAADQIALRTGPAGLVAEDLAREIPLAADTLRHPSTMEPLHDRLALVFPEP